MGETSDDVRTGWSRGWFAGLLFRTAEVDRLRRDLAVANARIETAQFALSGAQVDSDTTGGAT